MIHSLKTTHLYLAAMAACLFPVWSNQFLPMQDYPLHLFLAHALSSFNSPSLNWSENYILNTQITPYEITHQTIAFISEYIDIQYAGKSLISLYILLIGYISLPQKNDSNSSPSGVNILLFPVIFNQAYYLGFLNFIISIPILILALQQHINIRKNLNLKTRQLKHIATLALLFFIHPYTFLVYLVSAIFLQLTARHRNETTTSHSLIPVLSLLLFLAWLFSNNSPDNLLQGNFQTITWWDPLGLLFFYFTFLLNNSTLSPSSIIPYICWSTILVIIIPTITANIKTLIKTDFFQLFALTALGFLILPFYVGEYAYFNLRLAPISYFFLILALRNLSFTKKQSHTLSLCALLLIVHTSYLHYMTSRETKEIMPILDKIENNASLFPLYLDASSTHLNKIIYSSLHSHDHNYYHILVGGGVSPNVLPNKMFPILGRTFKSFYRDEPHDDTYLMSTAPMYQYLLIRHKNKYPTPVPPSQFRSVKKNKTWELFINTTIIK